MLAALGHRVVEANIVAKRLQRTPLRNPASEANAALHPPLSPAYSSGSIPFFCSSKIFTLRWNLPKRQQREAAREHRVVGPGGGTREE